MRSLKRECCLFYLFNNETELLHPAVASNNDRGLLAAAAGMNE
jgi:hypothetical protein